MPGDVQVLDPPTHSLRRRVRDVDGGLTFDELLSLSQEIVDRTSAQWRLGALFDIDQLWNPADAVHCDPEAVEAALPRLFDLARTIGDEALALGFPAIRDAADGLNACLQRIDVDCSKASACCLLVADLARSIATLQGALASS